MTSHPGIASWLIANRLEIEHALGQRLGPAAPGPGAPETEFLRRFRSFAVSALQRGTSSPPALDGLRANDRRVTALLAAWSDVAVELAGERGAEVRAPLEPLIAEFTLAVRATTTRRRASGAPRASRRAVTAAIDRVSDPYLAIDAESGHIVDANPAAGALLGVARDTLLGVEAMSFVPKGAEQFWWTELDAVTEGTEPRRFQASLRDRSGTDIPVDCSVTRFSTRSRTLALMVARPLNTAQEERAEVGGVVRPPSGEFPSAGPM